MQCNYLSLMSLAIILSSAYWVESAPHLKTIRLCSKSLSDALYLVCKTRGYNEPPSYVDGMESYSISNNGLGIVDECCYRACSLEQLKQYCRPVESEENSNGLIEESLRIVNLPFSPRQTVTMTESQAEGKIKS